MPYLTTIHTERLYYSVFGADDSKDAVMLVHGFAGTPESDFEGLLPDLQKQFTVIAPHLHGYGRSSQRTSYTADYYHEDVADLIALLDALGIQRVRVVGFSDGAIVALLLTALHPDHVERLAILGAQTSIDARDVAAIRHWLLERPIAEEWQAELTALHGESYWRSLLPLYVAVQEDLLAAGGVLITDEELEAVKCPVLVMHGARDRIVDPAYAQSIHERIAGSQLLIFDAGHAAHIRCKDEYVQAVMNFLTASDDSQ